MDILTSMAESVAARLKERGHTVAVSESAAGGLISAVLLAVPGASAYFAGGAVVYTREARRGLLGFSAEDSKMRGSTEEYALKAAREIREKLGTTWGLGESGAGDEQCDCCNGHDSDLHIVPPSWCLTEPSWLAFSWTHPTITYQDARAREK